MDFDGITKTLLALEHKYWQAIKQKDVDTALSLTDDPCLIAGSQGVGTVDHKKFVDIMRSAKYTLNDFQLKDGAQARMVGDNVAILAYNVHEDLTVDDQPISIDASDSSVWVRRNGKWLCVLHTESLHGDPYGRDRGAFPP